MLDNFENILDNAIDAHQQNNFLLASELYLNALELNPHNPDANHNLGLLFVQLGKVDEAILFLENAINSNPNVAQFWVSLSDALIKLNRLEDAKQIITQAAQIGHSDQNLKIMSDHLQVLSDTRNEIYIRDELSNEEIRKLRNLLKKKKYAELKLRINKLKLKNHSALLEEFMGLACNEQRKYQAAAKHYEKAFKIEPKSAAYAINLGVLYMKLEAYDEAIEVYQKAKLLAPNNPDIFFNLGVAYAEKKRKIEAISFYKKAIELDSKNEDAFLNLANIYADLDLIDDAISTVEHALELNPTRFEAVYNLGHFYTIKGEFSKAKIFLENSIQIDPLCARPFHAISGFTHFDFDNPLLAQMEKLKANNRHIDPENNALLDFALAKAYEDLGQIEKAFCHYMTGNQLRNKQHQYSIENDEYFFNGLKNLDEKVQSLAPKYSDSSISPIFILGMPRSGTTLVEQIISSHSDVSAGGELEVLSNFGKLLFNNDIKLTSQQLSVFSETYYKELTRYSQTTKFVTDKLPHNFRYISIIKAVFGNAKIVHVKRDPCATCWSNFKHLFTFGALEYSYDLSNLVKYYKLYEDLMDFWEKTYPNQIYTINYEKLVTEPKTETEKLLNYLELTHQVECFNPHKNTRGIKTASQSQARKKIYTGSSESWKKFKPYLDGAFDELIQH